MKYLYGCDVKKIQSYISGSSKLKEIAGASELVDCVCTELFEQFAGPSAKIIIAAAGKVRAVFDRHEDAARVMRGFPKLVAEGNGINIETDESVSGACQGYYGAEGLQLVQSVVEIREASITKADVDELENLLSQEIPMVSAIKDWSVIDKAPRSGRPAAEYRIEKGEDGKEKITALDLASVQKRKAVDKHWNNLRKVFFGKDWKKMVFPSDAGKISGTDSLLAVIHADGNSLGQTLMKLSASEDYEEKWKAFSRELDEATTEAAKTAYEHIGSRKFRPIVLGGDDLTVICSADDAVEFTRTYLEAFRAETKKRDVLGELTACAGIAFIKDKYPFHFGLELAEMLCGEAKRTAKQLKKENELDLVPSCLMFSLELGSFIEQDFSSIKERRLTAGEVTFDFGPYKTSGEIGMPDIDDLIEAARCLRKCNPLRNGIRRYISELHVNRQSAGFLAERVQQIAQEKSKMVFSEFADALGRLTRGGREQKPEAGLAELLVGRDGKTPALDLLVLSKFENKQQGEEINA